MLNSFAKDRARFRKLSNPVTSMKKKKVNVGIRLGLRCLNGLRVLRNLHVVIGELIPCG